MSTQVREVLARDEVTDALVLGGPAAVSSGVSAEMGRIPGVTVGRVSGQNRYETSAAFAEWAVDDAGLATPDHIGVTTGQDFPDALAGGPAAGKHEGVLLLTRGDRLSSTVDRFLRTRCDEDAQVRIFGGEAALTAYVENLVRNSLPEQ
jgi:hypothetical protein